MILKERNLSKRNEIVDEVVQRMDEGHVDYNYFLSTLQRIQAGFAGEVRLDRELADIQMPCEFVVVNDWEIPFHQMDSIFICPYFALVIEVKNISGRIELDDELHQFTRIRSDGVVDPFQNPTDQVRRHQRKVMQLFQQWGIHLPVECVVVFTHAQTNLVRIESEVRVFHVTGLQYKLQQLLAEHQVRLVCESTMRELGERLISIHEPRMWRPKIDVNVLKKGALCKKCCVVLIYRYGSWHCSVCGERNDTAHINGMRAYRIFWNEMISNEEFRAFFGINCSKTAYRLLKKMGLEYVGTYKDRKYVIPADLER